MWKGLSNIMDFLLDNYHYCGIPPWLLITFIVFMGWMFLCNTKLSVLNIIVFFLIAIAILYNFNLRLCVW
jgi:ABC-type proline/glycine betaine transport system permease subunit